MTRRELIQTGIGGMLLLNAAGCAPAPRDDRRAMLRAVAAVVLAGALPAGGEYEPALDRAVDGTETAIAGLPPAVVREVEQLFALLLLPVTRTFVAGVRPSWSRASHADVATFLTRWRTSSTRLFRSGYQALHQLVLAGWYGNDASWPATGYAGPPHLT